MTHRASIENGGARAGLTIRSVSCRFLAGTIACSVGTPTAAVAAAHAQELPQLILGAPVAAYPEGFESLAGVRELEDGRVLVSDDLGQALILWDPGAGADTLANVGDGPEEYGSPGPLFSLRNGGTLLLDFGNMRMTRIEADLSFGETWPLVQLGSGLEEGDAPKAVAGMRTTIPRATDSIGNVYYEQRLGSMFARSSSALIERRHLASGREEDVGKIGSAEKKRGLLDALSGFLSRIFGGRGRPSPPEPYSAEDAWSVTRDGRVIVARPRPDHYYLEWTDPGGDMVVGDPVPYVPVPVRDEDREQWKPPSEGPLLSIILAPDSIVSMAMQTPGPESDFDPGDLDWPDFKPPFPANAVSTDPYGRIWVQRHVPAGQQALYDLFDRNGRRIGQIELPEDRRLAGFGQNSIFLVRTDDFDWLEEYESPTLGVPAT